MDTYRFANIRREHKPYAEFLRTAKLSAGVYRLKAGAADTQQPHTEEEVDYVVSGSARFRSGDSDVSVGPGDILFVPEREPHRFYEIERDLELLVFFAPSECSAY